jgi:hypothetical protein
MLLLKKKSLNNQKDQVFELFEKSERSLPSPSIKATASSFVPAK